ncbi:MAG TPA: hypothetical protein ENJ13_04100 [Chromatiales bacterium]|nr:hypothetical protein [Chromatiales bacterium]
MFRLSRIRPLLRTVTCSMAVLLLTGCGQRGDLYLPKAAQLLNISVF